MNRAVELVRLPLLLLVTAWVTLLMVRAPGLETVQLPDGSGGSITVPKTLEGWRLRPGSGDVLLAGSTRLRLQTLEVTRTTLPASSDLAAYIAREHENLAKTESAYRIRLRGERRQFGRQLVPTGLGVYEGRFLGVSIDYLLRDLYYVHQGYYVRVRLRYPDMLDPYLTIDHLVIAPRISFKP